MIARTSQNIRPPAKPETALSLALKQALERAQGGQQSTEERRHGTR
jgi:hypothetical protein